MDIQIFHILLHMNCPTKLIVVWTIRILPFTVHEPLYETQNKSGDRVASIMTSVHYLEYLLHNHIWSTSCNRCHKIVTTNLIWSLSIDLLCQPYLKMRCLFPFLHMIDTPNNSLVWDLLSLITIIFITYCILISEPYSI